MATFDLDIDDIPDDEPININFSKIEESINLKL